MPVCVGRLFLGLEHQELSCRKGLTITTALWATTPCFVFYVQLLLVYSQRQL